VVQTALRRAGDRCAAEGQRWTPTRQRVYELVLRAGAPVKAYDIMDLYREGPAAKPPTVYRALEFLEQVGLVHRIPSLNAYVACHGDVEAHAAAFLICDCCGSAEEFEPGPIETTTKAAMAHQFAVRSIALEVRGLCRRCAD
jgi:Fur family zinc uptake transcriptional regulator